MKNLHKFHLLILSILGMFFLVHTSAQASTFTVSMNPSVNQIDSSYTYYYLKTEPGKDQTVSITVKNLTDKDITVQAGIKDATTNNVGQIVYSDQKELDETLKYPLSKIVKPEEEKITIPKDGEKNVDFKITPPSESYSGIIAGALSIKEYIPEESEGFKEVLGFDLGMTLSENSDEYRNGKTLLLNDVEATLKNRKRMVLASIQNPDPLIIDIETLNTKIVNKDTGEVVKEQNYKNFSMAPNTTVVLEYDWGIANLPSGNFIYQLDGSNSTDKWKLEKEFSISSSKAAEINQGSAFNVVTPLWVQIYAIINGIVFLIIIVLLFIRRKKLEAQMKIQRKKKKKKRKERKK